jgi:hypothetical protein
VVITILGYWTGLHYAVLVCTGLFALFGMFRDHPSILVYHDRFVFRFSNYFGRLFALDLTYRYDKVVKFAYGIDTWEATPAQSILMEVTERMLDSNARAETSKTPEAEVAVVYLNREGIECKKEFKFPLRYRSYLLALEHIKMNVEKCGAGKSGTYAYNKTPQTADT